MLDARRWSAPAVGSSTRRRVGLRAFLGPLVPPWPRGSCGGLAISCQPHHASPRSSSFHGRGLRSPICKTPASLLRPGLSGLPASSPRPALPPGLPAGQLRVGARAPLACPSPTSRISVAYYPSSQRRLGPRPRVASGAEPPVTPTRSSRVRHDERLLACGSPTCSPTCPVTGHRGGPAATSRLKGRFCWQLNRRSEWTGAYTTPVSGPGPVSGQRETAPGRARQTCELGRRLLSEPPRDRPLCLLVRKWTRRARAPSGSG